MTPVRFLGPVMAVLVAACSKPEPLTEVQVHRLDIPEVLLSCADVPNVPPRPRTREDLGRWIAALHEAHADCKARVEAIRELQKP